MVEARSGHQETLSRTCNTLKKHVSGPLALDGLVLRSPATGEGADGLLRKVVPVTVRSSLLTPRPQPGS